MDKGRSDLRDDARRARMARVLTELQRTGRVNASSQAAGVHPGLVCDWRRKYPDFAEQWAAALAVFETARLQTLAMPQRRSRYARWTQAKQEKFLDVLAATGNETGSARVVGMTKEAVYRLRRRDAAFRFAWASAVDQGFAQVEISLIDEAINGVAERPEGARPAASERIRSSVFNAGQKRAAALRGTTEDEAERDRNEAAAAKWIASLRAAIARFA